jgi:hypothetical protein
MNVKGSRGLLPNEAKAEPSLNPAPSLRAAAQKIPHMDWVRFQIAGKCVHVREPSVARVRAGKGFRRRGRFGYAAHAALKHDSILHR